VKNCPLPCIWQPGFWKTFSSISEENTQYIISHIRFAPTSWLAFWLAKRRNVPYIHIEHGTGFLVHNNPFIAWVAKIVDLTIGKYIIRHAEKVICISKAGKTWVSETFGREDIEVIYRGFAFPNVERRVNGVPKIGFVGRLTGLKNVN
jgi:glycosyltransferase involved in cell wall biosynthesis